MTSMTRSFLALAALTSGCATDQSIVYDVTPTPSDETEVPQATELPQPAIRVSTSDVDFGPQGQSCTAEREVEIFNDGNATLVVYSLALSITSSSDFSVEDKTLTIEPNGSASILVSYTASNPGEDSGAVLVQSNDASSGTVSLNLAGSAADAISDTERFTQTDGGPIDILMAFDTTSYARDEVGLIAAQVDVIVQRLNDSGMSWQLGAITIDPIDTGTMIGSYGDDGAPYLTSSASAEDISDFKSNIALRMAQFSTATTPGFQMMAVAINEENLAGPHAGFLRDEARLSLLIMSVYDDDSKNQTGQLTQIESMAELFVTAKGSEEQISFSAVVGIDRASDECPRQEGLRYQLMTKEFGGFAESVCSHHTEDTVAIMIEDFTGLSSVFELAGVPTDLNSLEVDVNGVAILQDDSDGWIFDPEQNAVVFNGDSIPASGEEIEVTFTRGALCE